MPRKVDARVVKRIKPAEEYSEVVQIDVEDPIHERKTAHGRRRLKLNDRERTLIKEKKLIDRAIVLFVEKSESIPKIAEQIGLETEVLAKAGISGDYPEMRAAIIDRAVRHFLDLENDRSREEIAEDLGLSMIQLRYLTSSKEFEERYNEFFFEITNDPTIKAVKHKIVEDLLPKAYRTLDALLSSAATKDTVRLKAALETLKLSGVEPNKNIQHDRRELAKFLADKTVNFNQINVSVPPDFKEAYEATLPIEGEYAEGSAGEDHPLDSGEDTGIESTT
jgi:hypothetical protein